MTTKVYVYDPQLASPATLPNEAIFGYTMLVWPEGLPGLVHPPFNDETSISVSWGETALAIKQAIIDKIVSSVSDVASNDIIFVGGWA
jgi:hypothetical protein